MPMIDGNTRAAIGANIKELIAAGYPRKQAVAMALKHARATDTSRRARRVTKK